MQSLSTPVDREIIICHADGSQTTRNQFATTNVPEQDDELEVAGVACLVAAVLLLPQGPSGEARHDMMRVYVRPLEDVKEDRMAQFTSLVMRALEREEAEAAQQAADSELVAPVDGGVEITPITAEQAFVQEGEPAFVAAMPVESQERRDFLDTIELPADTFAEEPQAELREVEGADISAAEQPAPAEAAPEPEKAKPSRSKKNHPRRG